MNSLEQAVLDLAVLRGQGKFAEAIALIEEALKVASPNDDLRVNANLEGLYAAEEAGLAEAAKRFAAGVAETDPDMPRIQKYR